MHKPSIYSFFILAFFIISDLVVWGQQLPNPFDFPILLSGNFGELRSNHFHSGIDFKTQGVEGKAIHTPQDGYVSRISVSPSGYGNALYLDHPDGTTSVYGHLLRFTPEVADYVKKQQYAQESFSINLNPPTDMFLFKKGEIIAWSGNTGNSAGNHLHFEIRDTRSEDVLDPVAYFKDKITDTRPPRIQGVMVCPVEGEGIVNGKSRKQEFKQFVMQDNKQTISARIEAWGKTGLAVKAYDYMDNTSNIYGVKEISLSVDGEEIFSSDITRFAFSETRYINSYTDYTEWSLNNSWYVKSFIEPGNKLGSLKAVNRGIIDIKEERTYHIIYTLSDIFGNKTRLYINIEGKKQNILPPDTVNNTRFYWAGENRFGSKGIRLNIPRGNLYKDFLFSYSIQEDSSALAPVHLLHNEPVALHSFATLSLKLQHDTLENKKQYGIVRIHKGKKYWTGGIYRTGWIDGRIRELGSYTLAQDVIPPSITPVNKNMWAKNNRISFRLSDNLSGVLKYRGEVDGKYVLFEMNNHSVITYKFDAERLGKGTHTLILSAEDTCGNRNTYEYSFTW